jgi:hypothetical protein
VLLAERLGLEPGGGALTSVVGAQHAEDGGEAAAVGAGHGFRLSFSSFVMRWLNVRFSLNP